LDDRWSESSMENESYKIDFYKGSKQTQLK